MIENNREITFESYLIERNTVTDPIEQSLFDFLYCTGTRISEALQVKRRDLDTDKKTVNILTEKNPKDPYRWVQLCPTAGPATPLYATILAQAEGKQPDEKLWGLNRHRAWMLSRRYFGCTVHSFRHTHAIQLVRDYGLSQVELMNQMGWWQIISCMSYLKYEGKDAIRKKLDF